MDLLIKNMEMPKRCGECKFAVNAYGSLKEGKCAVLGYGVTYLRERHDDCPLVEVPPHGRLIDADFYKKYAVRVHNSEGKEYIPADYIDIVPTVLEASK